MTRFVELLNYRESWVPEMVNLDLVVRVERPREPDELDSYVRLHFISGATMDVKLSYSEFREKFGEQPDRPERW